MSCRTQRAAARCDEPDTALTQKHVWFLKSALCHIQGLDLSVFLEWSKSCCSVGSYRERCIVGVLQFLRTCLQCVLWPILTSCVMCSVNTDEIHFYEWVHNVSCLIASLQEWTFWIICQSAQYPLSQNDCWRAQTKRIIVSAGGWQDGVSVLLMDKNTLHKRVIFILL